MATVIDALVVELGLDPAKFTKGQKEAVDSLRTMEGEARKRGKAIEESAKGVEQGFAAVQKRLLGVAGLLLGGLGIEQFVQRMTKLQVTTANVAKVFGLSSQSMQQWAAAGERVGVSGSAVQQGLQAIQNQRYNLRNFGEPGGLLRMQWGTAGTNNPLVVSRDGEMLSPEQQAMNIAKWLQKAGPQGANALMQMGGLNQDFIALLMQGPDKLKKLLEESKKLAPTDAEINKFKELNDSFEKAAQSATMLGRKITEDMIPGMVNLFNAISKIADWMSQHFGDGDAKKFSSPEEAARELSRRGRGLDVRGLEERLHRKEAELKANTDNLANAKGLYRVPLEREQAKLTEEIRKLREAIQRGGASSDPTVQKQSFLSPSGENVRVWKASFGGGGGGLSFGGFGGGQTPSGAPSPGTGGGRGAGGRAGGGNYVPDNSVGAGLTGSAYLAAQRAGIAAEIDKNPGLRDELAGMMRLEGTPLQSMESLANRYASTNAYRKARGMKPLSLSQMLHGGFYGPINRGQLPGAIAGLRRNPAEMRKMQDAIDAVVKRGSNTIEGATDQGMPSDPNGRHVGSDGFRLRRGGNVFNDWGGGGGHSWNEQWRRETQRRAKESDAASSSVPLPRARPSASDDMRAMLDVGRTRTAWGGPSSVRQGDMNIDNIHIHAPRSDAESLASSIRPAMERFARVASSNNGPA